MEYFKDVVIESNKVYHAKDPQKILAEMMKPKKRELSPESYTSDYLLYKAIGPIEVYTNDQRKLYEGQAKDIKADGVIRVGLHLANNKYRNMYEGPYINKDWTPDFLASLIEANITELLKAHGVELANKKEEETKMNETMNTTVTKKNEEESKMNEKERLQAKAKAELAINAGGKAPAGKATFTQVSKGNHSSVISREKYLELTAAGIFGGRYVNQDPDAAYEPLWFLRKQIQDKDTKRVYDLSSVIRYQPGDKYFGNNPHLGMNPDYAFDPQTGLLQKDENGVDKVFNALTFELASGFNVKKGYEFSVYWNLARMMHEYPIKYTVSDGKITFLRVPGLWSTMEVDDEKEESGKRTVWYYRVPGMNKVIEAQILAFAYDMLNRVFEATK